MLEVSPSRTGESGRALCLLGTGDQTNNAIAVDDPSVFIFQDTRGVAPGVKLPLSSAAACLPEDWNRHEVGSWCLERSLPSHKYLIYVRERRFTKGRW